MKKTKKFLGLLMAIAMVVGLLSTGAFAAGETKEVIVPLRQFVYQEGNVAPDAKDFAADLRLIAVDEDGNEIDDVTEEMGLVVTDDTIVTDGSVVNDYYDDAVAFTVPAEKYAELVGYKLRVDISVDGKGWEMGNDYFFVSFSEGDGDDLVIECDNPNLPSAPIGIAFSYFTARDVQIPVTTTVKVGGTGEADPENFTFEVYPVGDVTSEPGLIEGTLGEKLAAVTGNTVATDGAGEYKSVVTVRLYGDEFNAFGNTNLLITEVDGGTENWQYMSNGLSSWWVEIEPGEQVNSLDLDAPAPEADNSSLGNFEFNYYPAMLNGSQVSGMRPLSGGSAGTRATFENTYVIPVPVVINIPFTKTVIRQGYVGGNIPEETFTFDVSFPYNSQVALGEGDIVAAIDTDGEGTYNGMITITMTDSEFDSCLNGGSFAVLIRENTDFSDPRWSTLDMAYWVEFSGWVVNSLEEGEAPEASISKIPSAEANYYLATRGDNGYTPNREMTVPSVTFANTYTVPGYTTITIPFTKVVTLGGNRGPVREVFEFDLLLPYYDGELDMTVSGATVTTNGAGTYDDGLITITIPEDQIGNLTEGMVLVERNTGKPNWTYDDTAWWIQLADAPEINSLRQPTVSDYDYVVEFYEAETFTEEDQVYYRPIGDEPVEEIVFENVFTKNAAEPTPSKPVLNKEDHMAFMQGYPDGTFGAKKNITRAEVAVMFARLLTEKMDADKTYTNTFTDVASDAWYYNYIGYMQQFGIINGYEDGSFRPDASITRAEFAAIACRFEELTKGEAKFSDVTEAHWAYDYINFAAARGWVTGYQDGTFKPGAFITREEVVAVTCRLLERSADQDYIEKNAASLKRVYSDVTKDDWSYWYILEASNGHDYTKEAAKETWAGIHK